MGSAVQFRLAPLFLFDLLTFGLMMERKQIYTPEFKRWFGDWEKPLRIEKLRKSQYAYIKGNEVQPDADIKEYGKNARKYAKTLRKDYTNNDTGRKIILKSGRKNGGIREILEHDYKDIWHLQSVAAIPQIIEKSIYIATLPNEDTKVNVESFDYFVCGLKIGMVDYTVKSVVVVLPDGERYYDHKLTTIEKGELIDLINKKPESASNPISSESSAESGRLDEYKDKRLISILQKNSSKIVDRFGRPLVVYHGTPDGDFDTFRSDYAKAEDGFWFTSDYDLAYEYSLEDNESGELPENSRVFEVYLNMRNPIILDAHGRTYADMEREILRATQNTNFDGVIVENVIDVKFNNSANRKPVTTFFVHNANQIKSDSRNNGQFSPESDNILQGIDYSDAKFKVGDTVKCTAMGRPSYGEVFTIKKVHKIKGKYEYDGSNGVYNYEEYSLELIQRNKPYDPAECLRVLDYICRDCFKKPISFVTVGYDGIFLSYCLGGKFGKIEERLNQYLWGKDILKSFVSSREKNKQGITYSIKNDAAILDYVKEQIDYPSLERKPEMFKVGNVYYDDKWVYQVVKAYRDEKTAADECRIAKINDKGSWDDSTYSVQTAALIFKDCTFYGNESTQLLSLEWEDKKAFYNKVKPFKSRVQAILDKYHSKAKICRTYAKGSHIKGGIVRPCDEVWIQSSPYDRFPLVEDDFDGNDELEYEMICMIADLRENKHYDKETDKLVENTTDDRDRRLRLAKAKAKALKMKLELMKI